MRVANFVFGSNLAGIHGAGAAKAALNLYGAVWGEGVGHFGNSYAIPTKDREIITMKLDEIEPYVKDFISYTNANPDIDFLVTAIGTGLAGIPVLDMAHMFVDENGEFPTNVYLPELFQLALNGAVDPYRTSFDLSDSLVYGTL